MSKVHLNNDQKTKIGWVWQERAVLVLCRMFIVFAIIGFFIISSGGVIATIVRNYYHAVWVYDLPVFLLYIVTFFISILIFFLLAIFMIALLSKLNVRNYHRFFPISLGFVIMEALWLVLIIAFVLTSGSGSRFFSIVLYITPFAEAIICIIASLFYKRVYRTDVTGQNTLQPVSEEQCKNMQAVGLVLSVGMLGIIILILYVAINYL